MSMMKKKVGSPMKQVATNIQDPMELSFKTTTVYMIPITIKTK